MAPCRLQPRGKRLAKTPYYVTKPFNIASYALLTMMVAQVCDLKVGDFVHTFGDAHLYLNHMEQVDTQLARDTFPLPTIKFWGVLGEFWEHNT